MQDGINKSVEFIHPGVIFKRDILDPRCLSIGWAAQMMGVTRMTLSKIVNGNGAITPNIAIRIEFVFGQNAEHWLSLQRDYDLKLARENFTDFDKMKRFR